MKRRWFAAFIGVLVLGIGIFQASSGRTETAGMISASIRSMLESDLYLSGPLKPESVKALSRYYEGRSWNPYWVDGNGLSALANDWIQTIRTAWLHGLRPNDYHLELLNQYADQLQKMRVRAGNADPRIGIMDVLLTDAFFRFSTHLLEGKVSPQHFDPHWISPDHKSDIMEMMNRLSVRRNIQETIHELAPPHADYWRLAHASVQLKSVADAGGWPVVEAESTMRPGDRSPRVDRLRTRLALSGDLETATEGGDLFDPMLEAAVRRFQFRHGLTIDGIVGKDTFAALNVAADQRWRQLMLNMERWRWLPRQWQDCRIIVNIAGFMLQGYRGDRKQIEMPVIVGKAYHKTPVFSEKMGYMVINPYWNVPSSIAVNELLPRLRKDPGYLVRNHYEVVAGWESPVRVINPAQIDWKTVRAGSFPGRIRQKPGPWNALGRIKFMFPNRFHVYLHDTPDRRLFSNPRRAYSHGCIRVGSPTDLAMFLLQDDPSWTRERLEQLIATGERRTVRISQACAVHLLYWTAWIDENGELNFRDDIYERDKPLWNALNQDSGRYVDFPDRLPGP